MLTAQQFRKIDSFLMLSAISEYLVYFLGIFAICLQNLSTVNFIVFRADRDEF